MALSGNQVGGFAIYGGIGHPRGDYSGKAVQVFAAVTGTAGDGALESEIVAGGETLVLTLTNDTWVTAGATFNAERQGIIDGLDSDGVEATGWNAEVRDKLDVSAVVRTSDTVVTITLSAAADYAIASDETVTVTVPADALTTSSGAVVASPAFTITAAAEPSTGRGGFLPLGVRTTRKTFERFEREINLAIERALTEQAPETLEPEPAKLTKPKARKVTRQIIAEVIDSGALIGKLDAIEETVTQLVNRDLARRRIESRKVEREAQLARMREEEMVLALVMLLESE